MLFQTERISVRLLLPTDGDNYFSIHGDAEVMRYIRAAKTREQCDAFLLEHLESNRKLFPLGRFMMETRFSGEFIGTFVLFPINDSALIQIGYSLLKKFWGQGYASEVTRAGIDYFFANSVDESLYAIVERANIPSEKVLLKNGFQPDQEFMENNTPLLRLKLNRSDAQKSGFTPV